MSEAARAAVLEAHCRELKLPTVRRSYPELVREATQHGWDYEEFLVQLLEAEVLVRRDGAVARLLRQARFPDLKTLEQLDWEALRGVERPQLAQLATCAYIERAEDVVIAGPIGTGKTHLAIALGVEAARRRHRVAFVRAADLVRELVEARDELTLSQTAAALPAGRAADRRRARLRALRAHRRRADLQPPRRPLRAALNDRHHQPDMDAIVSSTEPRFPRRPAPLRRRPCEDDDSEPGKEG